MATTDPAGKNILVVDDDPSICYFFEMLLSRDGFNVVAVNNGEKALGVLKSRTYGKFDLLILDLMMPGRGGYDVLKELQQISYQKVPVFVVTARALDTGTVDMIRSESNVQEFWSKPINPKEFKTKVHALLGTIPRAAKGGFDDWKD